VIVSQTVQVAPKVLLAALFDGTASTGCHVVRSSAVAMGRTKYGCPNRD
jgi:hypothetical protein